MTKDGILSTLTDKSVPVAKDQFTSPERQNGKGKSMRNISPEKVHKKEEIKPKAPTLNKSSTDKVIIPSPNIPKENPISSIRSTKVTRNLNSISEYPSSMTPILREKPGAKNVPISSIYSSPDMPMRFLSQSSIFHNHSNPFMRASHEQMSFLSQRLADFIDQKRSVTGDINKYKKPVKKLETDENRDSIMGHQQKNFGYSFRFNTQTDEIKKSGLSFVDRQERMVSKYKLGSYRHETDPVNMRLERLTTFNY